MEGSGRAGKAEVEEKGEREEARDRQRRLKEGLREKKKWMGRGKGIRERRRWRMSGRKRREMGGARSSA